jgi:8-amino-7-oxononanoate synthase
MPYDPLDWLDAELVRLTRDHLLRRATVRAGGQGATIEIDGQQMVNFGSNDYLGLAADPRVAAAAGQGIAQQGWGSGASPLITGRTESQAELERELAAFERTESALVFPSGFAANVGAVTSLAGRGDVIFSDAKNHASLVDGCRLSRAEVQVYAHADVDHLRQLLSAAAGYRRRLIVSDTLFSMDGDLAPLPDLVQLAADHRAMLLVDEAHATGVFGTNGQGVCEHFQLEAAVPVRVGTLSKALGSIGGFVVGQQRLIDWLFNRARPQVFSTALPAACHRAGVAAVHLVRAEPLRRRQLLQRAAALREALRGQGWSVGRSASQIIPLEIGDPQRTMDLAGRLRQRGLLVPGIRPPTVPVGQSLLRISLSYLHQDADCECLLTALRELRSRLRTETRRHRGRVGD